jgi:hypothetical protein
MRNLSMRAKLGIWIGGPIGLLIIIVVLAGIFAPTPRPASASGDLTSPSSTAVSTTATPTIPSAPPDTSSATALATSTPSQTAAPTSPSPTYTTAPKPKPKPKPKPSPSPTHKAVSLCGAPTNPWGFNFCGRGHSIRPSALPDAVCSYFDCIPSFYDGNGYMVECRDASYSMSGGIQGACSHHGGVWREVYSG